MKLHQRPFRETAWFAFNEEAAEAEGLQEHRCPPPGWPLSFPLNQLILLSLDHDPPKRPVLTRPKRACVKFLKLLMPPKKGLGNRHPPPLSSVTVEAPTDILTLPSPSVAIEMSGGQCTAFNLEDGGWAGPLQMNPKHSAIQFLVFFTAVFGILSAFQVTSKVIITLVT